MHQQRLSRTLALTLAFGCVLAHLPASAADSTKPADRGSTPFARGIISEFLSETAKHVVDNSIGLALTAINDETNDPATGFLLKMLEGTTGDALNEIEKQITVTQDMITNLQADLDKFQNTVNSSLAKIDDDVLRGNYQAKLQVIDTCQANIKTLDILYQTILDTCCVQENGKAKLGPDGDPILISPLPDNGKSAIKAFVSTMDTENMYTQIMNIEAVTNPASNYSSSVYYAAEACYQNNVGTDFPFEHQSYAPMYSLFNYINSVRTSALKYYGEYLSYTHPDDSDLSGTNFPALVTQVRNDINAEVENSPTLKKLGVLLAGYDATTSTQSALDYLDSNDYFIEQTYDLVDDVRALTTPGGGPAYKVVSNHDKHTYVILKEPGSLVMVTTPLPSTSETSFKSKYDTYFNNRTQDGRFVMVSDPAQLTGLLFNAGGGDILTFLKINGGLAKLDTLQKAAGIVLAKTTAMTYTAVSAAASGPTTSTTAYGHYLYLLDIHTFNTQDATCFTLPLESRKDNTGEWDPKMYEPTELDFGRNVYNFGTSTSKLGEAKFLSIYRDTNISTIMKGIGNTDGTTTYRPITAFTSSAAPAMFSLGDGDILDLTAMSVSSLTSLPCTIRISGNATLIGGGSGHQISDMKIETYGGNLTVQNLYLSSTTDVIINNIFGPLTLTALGVNQFKSSAANGVVYSSSGRLVTITGLNQTSPVLNCSLSVENTSTGPAINTTGSLLISNASNLAVTSAGPTSIAGSVSGVNSTVVSTVATGKTGVAANNELPGAVSFTNCALTLNYGPLPAAVTLTNTTVAYSEICATLTVTTDQKAKAGTTSALRLAMVYDGGKESNVVRFDNIVTSGSFQQSSTAVVTVNMGPYTQPLISGLQNIEGIILNCDQSGSMPNWRVHSVTVALGAKVVTISPMMWILDNGNKFFGTTPENTGEFYVTAHTGLNLLNGTAADIYLKIIGTNGETEYQNIRHIVADPLSPGNNYDAFQIGSYDDFAMAFTGVVYSKPGIQGIGTPTHVSMYTDDFWSMDPWYCVYMDISPVLANGANGTLQHFPINKWVPHQASGITDATAPFPVGERSPKWYPHIDFYHPGHDNQTQYQVEIFSGSTRLLSTIIRKRCYVESLDYINAGSQGLLPGTYSVKISKLVGDNYELVKTLPLTVADYGPATAVNVIPEPTLDQGTYSFNFGLVNASGYELEIQHGGVTVQSTTVQLRPDARGVLRPDQATTKGGVVLSAPGEYRWILRALNPLTGGNEVGTISAFTIATPVQPDADFNQTPAVYGNMLPSGTIGTAVNGVLPVTFTWNPVPGAKTYFLYVSTAGGDVVLNRVKIDGDTAYGPVNLPEGEYSWNVIATNANGVATWSKAVNFLIRTDLQTNTTTPVINLVLPINDAELSNAPAQVEFLISWDVAGDQQELWLYREDTGETYTATSAVVVHPLTHVSTIAVAAANFLAPGTYYWQVRGLKGTVQGQWSAVRVYAILPAGTDLGKPILTTMQGRDITVEFPVGTVVPGQVQFDVLAKLNGAFSNLSLAPVSGALAVTIPWAAWVAKNASLGTTKAAIFVRVRGMSDAATGPWSDWASYTNP